MSTAPILTTCKPTPEFDLGALTNCLRQHRRDPLMVKVDGSIMLEDRELGSSLMVPFGQRGVPMSQVTKIADHFLARVSVMHLPRGKAGVPNLWRSSYRAPDGMLNLSFYRSGTPVLATTRGVLTGTPKNPDSDVVVDEDHTRENVTLLRDAITRQQLPRGVANFTHSPARRGIITIDLQSPVGIPAEVPITAMQRQASAGHLQYLNIPVHAKTFGMPGHWQIPADSMTMMWQLCRDARELILPNTKYTRALHDLIVESEMLMQQHQEEKSVPATRYALAARIGLAAQLVGYELHVNCRSGKDRTAIFDTEIKFAAYQVWRRAHNLPVSAPGAAVLPQEKRAWELLLLRSGNREIQFVNAGTPGNRVGSIHLKERVGEELWKEYVGNAKAAED